MSIHPDAVPDEIKSLLDEVLARKLCFVSPNLYPAITIGDILFNTKSTKFPFPDSFSHPAPHPSATLAGILVNMGQIKKYLVEPNFHSSFGEWDREILLSFFCANLEKSNGVSYYSFDTYYKETRIRLYKAVMAHHTGTATDVQKAYIKACLEAKDGEAAQRTDTSPTLHREMFVVALQQHPEDFMCYSANTIKAIHKLMAEMLDRFKVITKNLENQGHVHGKLLALGQLFGSLFKRPDARETGTKVFSQSKELISFDCSYFPDTILQHNTLLRALLKSEPGFAPYYKVDIEEHGPFNLAEITNALADTKTVKDEENFDDDFKFWDQKKFDHMADCFFIEE